MTAHGNRSTAYTSMGSSHTSVHLLKNVSRDTSRNVVRFFKALLLLAAPPSQGTPNKITLWILITHHQRFTVSPQWPETENSLPSRPGDWDLPHLCVLWMSSTPDLLSVFTPVSPCMSSSEGLLPISKTFSPACPHHQTCPSDPFVPCITASCFFTSLMRATVSSVCWKSDNTTTIEIQWIGKAWSCLWTNVASHARLYYQVVIGSLPYVLSISLQTNAAYWYWPIVSDNFYVTSFKDFAYCLLLQSLATDPLYRFFFLHFSSSLSVASAHILST